MAVAPLASAFRPSAGAPNPLLRLRAAVLAHHDHGRARIAVNGDGLDPLAWVGAVPEDARLAYFAGRDGDAAVLAVGTAEVRSARGAATAPPGWRYVGGMGFDERADAASFVAPVVELGRAAGRSWVAANLLGGSELERRRALSVIDAMIAAGNGPRLGVAPGQVLRREERPDRAGWQRMMTRVLHAIDAGEVDKVVLARQVELTFDAPVDPALTLARLARYEPRSFRFLLRTDEATFVGASPERLFARSGREVVSEALAGTRRRGRDDAEDGRRGAELLAADKDRREHRFVVDAVTAALGRVCETVATERAPTVMATGSLLHLRTSAAGALRAGVDDADLLAALHPTPAMCGWPTSAARALLREVEPFSRGSYAAPLGWVGRDGAEIAVGIRAVALHGDRAVLTAGAGVVRGSDPEAEWRETEAKLAGVLSAVTA